MSSASWRIKYNYGTQYIQEGGAVPGKTEDQNYYRGELGVQLGVMCTIKIMESTLVSTTLVVNSYDNKSALRQSFDKPKISNIMMETIRPYLPPV